MARVLLKNQLTSHYGMQKRSQITLQSDFLGCINMCRVRRFFSKRTTLEQCLNIFAPTFRHPIRSLTLYTRNSGTICTQTSPEGGLQTAGLEGHVLVAFPVTLCACVLSLKPHTPKSCLRCVGTFTVNGAIPEVLATNTITGGIE
mgnify:CR=1 FL=1